MTLKVFQVIEHPFEHDKLSTLQDLVLAERENLLNLIFNLTSKMSDYELKVLRAFVNYGSITYSNGYDRVEQDFESDYREPLLKCKHFSKSLWLKVKFQNTFGQFV